MVRSIPILDKQWFLNSTLLVAIAGSTLTFAAAPQQKEIEGPAGDLPEGDDDTAESDNDDTGLLSKSTAKVKKSAITAKPSKGAAATWDSYSDLNKSASIAKEVTNGVRVEDIVETPSDYRYAAFGRPDPFVPPLIAHDEETQEGPGSLEIPLVSPLQRFDLETLSVVGIWQLKSGERKAMVMTPAGSASGGAGVIVKNGDLIGKRGGKILGIGEDYLNVREFTLAPDGSRRFEDHQMYMGKRADDDLAGRIRFKPGERNTEIIYQKDALHGTPEGRETQAKDMGRATGVLSRAAAAQAPASESGNVSPGATSTDTPRVSQFGGKPQYVPGGGSASGSGSAAPPPAPLKK